MTCPNCKKAIEECESACLKIMCDKCKEKLNEKQ